MQIRYGSEKITNFLKWNKNNGITAASIAHSYVDIWFSRFIETNPVPVPRKNMFKNPQEGEWREGTKWQYRRTWHWKAIRVRGK